MGTTTIQGATTLVTGAGSGIGRSISLALARAGATVVATDIDADTAAETARLSGAQAESRHLDVAFAALAEDVRTRRGGIDVLVNNAGIGIAGDVEHLTGDHWDRQLDVNIGGVVNGILAVYPAMVASGRGHIVNMASLAGLGPVGLLTAYATAKHAVVGLSTSLAAEAAAKGVVVTVVCPAAVDTGLLDRRGSADMVTSGMDVRRYLTDILGPPYPPDRLADDVVRAISRQTTVLVRPGKARAAWVASRVSPAASRWLATRAVAKERQKALAAR